MKPSHRLKATKNRFGFHLRQYRLDAGLSQEDLGVLTGSQKSCISSWELGHWYPQPSIVPLLETALGVPAGDLQRYIPDEEA